jgi:hypothetical protein
MKHQSVAEIKPECPQTPLEPRLLDKRWDGRSTFSVPETAGILGVGLSAAWAAVKSGEIGTVRLGNRVIVPRYVVERLLTVA